ncbi:MAG: glycosyltransferase [Cyclobacteriaceae bacterium]|nr:glycosyltransferase [Cyclobacteriaceae bacterium]
MLLPETLKLHDQQRFEFHYIYFLPWKNQMVEAIREAGGVVHCFDASDNIRIILRVWRVIRYIRNHEIQLVHCHLPWAGFVGRLVHLITRIPVVYTEHNKQERYHGITFWLNKLTFNWQNRALAVSADVAESIQQNIKPSIPVQIVLNGVNTSAFQRNREAGRALRQQLGIPESAVVLGTMAVFRFQKRLVEWLEVMAEVCRKHHQVYGIIVGDGPLKEEIEHKRSALGLEDRIMMPGLQTEVKPWLSAMDIYIMSSVFEGLPIALLEAMSMECAIVSTDAGGIKELIRHEADGLLVQVDQWKALAQQVEKLLPKEVRDGYGLRARARVENEFSLTRMVHLLEQIYRQEAATGEIPS